MENIKTVYALTTAEALKMIRKADVGIKFRLQLRFDLPIEGNPERQYQGAGTGYISISRKDALRIIKEMVRESLEAKGARIPLTVNTESCPILGTRTLYWIG